LTQSEKILILNSAIKIENLYKQYRLGLIGTGTLSHDLNRWWHRIRGKDDPYLKIAEINDRTAKSNNGYVWALREININVGHGEVLGIIGKNGAGKSTLLKILSKVTAPTIGTIKYQGRIGSLLEVGTGFHPELTGRENIFLNGAVLGMKKKEIISKFDAIVDFSGCERYIDTPVKRYSSGMTVRLGFAVAAFLEPEILVVDEVLAVGDAEFQSKAVGKMKDVSRREGRTVLFVSHNMNVINSLCNRVVLLENGAVLDSGAPREMINRYISLATVNSEVNETASSDFPEGSSCRFISVRLIDGAGDTAGYIDREKEIGVEFSFEIKLRLKGVANINLYTGGGTHILFSSENEREEPYEPGIYSAVVRIPAGLLNAGLYSVSVYFTSLIPYKIHFERREILNFEVFEDINRRNINYVGQISGIIRPDLNWTVKKTK
jgi:lipopolysaccharide transport system ATP-binding protein